MMLDNLHWVDQQSLLAPYFVAKASYKSQRRAENKNGLSREDIIPIRSQLTQQSLKETHPASVQYEPGTYFERKIA